MEIEEIKVLTTIANVYETHVDQYTSKFCIRSRWRNKVYDDDRRIKTYLKTSVHYQWHIYGRGWGSPKSPVFKLNTMFLSKYNCVGF